MKRFVLASVAAALALTLSPAAIADYHTVTIGYAQSDVQYIKNTKGVNLKYRYELGQDDEPFSIITSFSYMSGKRSSNRLTNVEASTTKLDITYYSLTVGPAYRINDVISVYALAGGVYNNAKTTSAWQNMGSRLYWTRYSENNTDFAYGAGLQINPTHNLAIDLGYEGSHIKVGTDSLTVNGFNVGVGYRF